MTIIRGLDIADYFAAEDVSSTKAKDFHTSPRLFEDKWVTKVIPGFDADNETTALTFGKAFEAILCDDVGIFGAHPRPRQFDAFAVKPEAPDKRADGRTVEGKEWALAHKHKPVISSAEHKRAGRMVQSIAELEERAMLRECEQQVTFRATVHGVKLQSRPDFVCLKGSAWSDWQPYTLDLKTCEDLDRILNGRAIVEYGYHRQAQIAGLCMAEHVKAEPKHFLLAVEKGAAHRAAVVDLEDYLADANTWVLSTLERMAECQRTGRYPRNVQRGIVRLSRPNWLKDEEWVAA